MGRKLKNIKDVARMVSSRTGMTVEDSEIAVRTTFDVVKQLMYEQNDVNIPSFAVFFLKKLASKSVGLPDGRKLFKESHYATRIRYSVLFKAQVRKIKCTQE